MAGSCFNNSLHMLQHDFLSHEESTNERLLSINEKLGCFLEHVTELLKERPTPTDLKVRENLEC